MKGQQQQVRAIWSVILSLFAPGENGSSLKFTNQETAEVMTPYIEVMKQSIESVRSLAVFAGYPMVDVEATGIGQVHESIQVKQYQLQRCKPLEMPVTQRHQSYLNIYGGNGPTCRR